MNKRQVVINAIEGRKVPYVPWHCDFTVEAADVLKSHFGCSDLDECLGNHFLRVGHTSEFSDMGNNRFRDMFGVVWDRSCDKDIGIVTDFILRNPTFKGYTFPNPSDERIFYDIEKNIKLHPSLYSIFPIGFSLYERAWTLRGMENLMMDFYENPNFVHDLLHAIADFNIVMITHALTFDIDAVYFGDDWGQQSGLQMGPDLWREFILPQLKRMYSVVKKAGKHIFIHSCGDVDEVFDDLIDAGVDCFNPFQPEVMPIFELMKRYRGRLAFHGGLSTQQTLPHETPDEVRRQTRELLAAGKNGGYIFAPAHAVESDVPLENMLAFIEILKDQNGYVQRQ